MKQRFKPVYTILIFVLCLSLLAGLAAYVINMRILNIDFQSTLTEESTDNVTNPYRGFYQLYGYTLTEESVATTRKWADKILETADQQLVLLQINLRNYSSRNLSPNALDQLNVLLDTFTYKDKQLILRFLYDWNGEAAKTEPKDIKQIAGHMKQLANIVNKYKSHVYIIQGIGTGNCGEMTGTNYSDEGEITYLMDSQAAAFDQSIFMSVRTPAHLRAILKTHVPLAYATPYSNVLAARLGLYNDGIMGSVYDLGTYDDTSISQSTGLLDKGTRPEELEFQNQLCNYVPNGGEVVIDNKYNDIHNAVQDLNNMHVSYLNLDHDPAVLNKWKKSTYEGQNGFDYIEAHLGYRYVVSHVGWDFHSLLDSTAKLNLSITNTGFAPAYRRFKTSLVLENTTTKITKVIDISLDNRSILSQTTSTISLELPVREYDKGDYIIKLSMTDTATSLPITMANEGASETLVIGQFTIK